MRERLTGNSCCMPGRRSAIPTTAIPSPPLIEATERLIGCAIQRPLVNKGYRGHDTPNRHRAFISGQRCGGFGAIKRELRRAPRSKPHEN
jgi:hypothetical protein